MAQRRFVTRSAGAMMLRCTACSPKENSLVSLFRASALRNVGPRAEAKAR